MKKILAILLAALMVFSLGLTAFAEGEEENTGILLPPFPAQTEGEIYLVSENTYVNAGETVEIPVYIVSDYTSEACPESEYILLGINFTLTGDAFNNGYMNITGIRASEEVQALNGYELIVADARDMYCNMFGIKVADESILHQESMPIAYVTVTVAENYPGYNEDGTEMDCQLDVGAPVWYEYSDRAYADFATAQIELWNDTTGEFEQIDAGFDILYIVSGHVIQTPPVPTWEERLKAWAIEQAIKIITFFQGLNEVLLGLLPTL